MCLNFLLGLFLYFWVIPVYFFKTFCTIHIPKHLQTNKQTNKIKPKTKQNIPTINQTNKKDMQYFPKAL